jgi:hypothetical protein
MSSAASERISNDLSDFSDFQSTNETLQWGTDSECAVEGFGKRHFGIQCWWENSENGGVESFIRSTISIQDSVYERRIEKRLEIF